jgi:hypothetical protein
VTEPDLVDGRIPPEQIRVGDLLIADDGGAARVEHLITDLGREYVYAFTPQQTPLRRGEPVRIQRPRTPPRPAPTVDPAEVDALRDLLLAVVDTQAPAARKVLADKVDRVRKAKP